MAKYEARIKGNFDKVLAKIEQGILSGSISATLEDKSDFEDENIRCSVRVFERYSYFGSNRVSLNVTLFQSTKDYLELSAITSGGSRAIFWKINTIGEENFLNKLKEVLYENFK